MASPPRPPLALEDRDAEGARMFSPSAGRNKGPISDILADLLPHGARVLELGSGTGEHAEAACARRPDLVWTPSDPDAASRASCAARARASSGAIQPPLDIDLTQEGWSRDVPPCDAMFCANTIHIAPWEAAEGLAREAPQRLTAGGRILLYGPFLHGEDSAPSNLAFDADLKRRDPRWGVRRLQDVEALFDSHGYSLEKSVAMPANNEVLVFARRGEPVSG